ncbi:MAG: hypothetical protein IH590_05995 [Aquamicrobium sp.]|nr:hypothetical protein [Aquamicrobium sp.]
MTAAATTAFWRKTAGIGALTGAADHRGFGNGAGPINRLWSRRISDG